MIGNPSIRFFCEWKKNLDKVLIDIEKARKAGSGEVLSVTLLLYCAGREKARCEGCKIGADKCVHWSPEKIEVNRS